MSSNKKRNLTNRLPQTGASSKVGKGRHSSKPAHHRSAQTIQRLKMYTTGKPIRNKSGKVVAGIYSSSHRAGDRPLDASTGRIQPDRRWFGNTRTVDPRSLDEFRTQMTESVADPYSVVLKRKQLPMQLLQDAAATSTAAAGKAALLEQEPFERAFGAKSRRKRVKLDQLLVSRAKTTAKQQKQKQHAAETSKAEPVATHAHDADGYAALLTTAQSSQDTYQQINTAEGMVPWGRDEQQQQIDKDWRLAKKDDLFLKGQSKRIWAEFFKVLDCSHVVLHVMDARNVPGTRCTMIETHMQKHCPHKHLVFVLNKIDLVPNWVAQRWMGELAAIRPTVAFQASRAFGKGALISLLRQFGKLSSSNEQQQKTKEISVGVVGYPNVGKSSVINTLCGKKAVKVAPVPGETKIWQYVSLFGNISLIDCPGVVVDTAGDTETDSVLKGVVRAERLEHPQDFCAAIEERVQRQHIVAQYKLPRNNADWKSTEQLLEMIATKYGRLRKGGDPCLRSAAIMLINDFQRGRLPHFVAPPELKEETAVEENSRLQTAQQNLDAIGQEHMHHEENSGEGSDISPEEEESRPTEAAAEDSAPIQASEDLIGAGEWDD